MVNYSQGSYRRIAEIAIIVLLGINVLSNSSWAQWGDQDEEELMLAYGGEEFVTIATGNLQAVSRAPSATTVITSAQIKKIGATDLDEVLETVPGLHVSVSPIGYNSIYQIRGITSKFNPQVLMLVNGIPVTEVFTGSRGLVWGGMQVNNIARVEVIRGPGSALYGADAFAGVINIITKTSKDINGIEAGARYGSFDDKAGWLLAGHTWKGWDIAVSFEYDEQEGHKEHIAKDAQSFFDGAFGTSASLAPGPVSLQRQRIDTRLDLAKDEWRFRAGYQGRKDGGVGAGGNDALDPVGRGDSDRFNADLTYETDDLIEDWTLKGQFSFLSISDRSDLVLFPPGAFIGTFPNGVQGNPDVSERHYRLELSGLYSGFSAHKLRGGVGFRLEDLFKVKELKNFKIAPDPVTGIRRPVPRDDGLVSVTGSDAFIQETDRTVRYFFLQDEWNFIRDWTITAGFRFDHYSDFGATFNPRVALVWQTTYSLTSKLLYGRAFRPPSFQEQKLRNNPVVEGNSDLDPETVDWVELAFDYSPNDSIRSELNLYWYHMDEVLRFGDQASTNTDGSVAKATNSGNREGYGFELAASWKVSSSLGLHVNYAFQNSRDNTVNDHVGMAPTHQIYTRTDWAFLPHWNLDMEANWVAYRKRSPADPRPQVGDYVIVDLTLRREKIAEHWGFSLSLRNLLDENAHEPSPFSDVTGSTGSFIPYDLPLAGRSIYGEIRFELQ